MERMKFDPLKGCILFPFRIHVDPFSEGKQNSLSEFPPLKVFLSLNFGRITKG